MLMQTIESDAIAAIGYDPGAQILRVTFHNGRTYEYLGVPPEENGRLMSAESRGTYLNQVIKPKYAAHEV
jgi:hypothetical protein